MDPITRQEQYLNAIAGGDNDVPATPQTREEWFLNQILENGGGQVDPEAIAEAVADWLDDHVDPETGYVIDNSLSVEGAAADAKAAGDEIADFKSALTDISYFRKSVYDGRYIDITNRTVGITNSWGYISYNTTNLAGKTVTYRTKLYNGSNAGLSCIAKDGTYISGTNVANGTLTIT